MPDLSETGWQRHVPLYEYLINMQDGTAHRHRNIENSLVENGFLFLYWKDNTRAYNMTNIVDFTISLQTGDVADGPIPFKKKKGTAA